MADPEASGSNPALDLDEPVRQTRIVRSRTH